MDWRPTIGLEIHAELKTKTKLFCNSRNDPDEKRPNVNVCPICMGHPGTLPVMNKEAVKKILLIGLAVRGEISDFTAFDRKNYFYPDIPKGYQISQYKFPLVRGGELAGVALERIHLEEDTARSIHEDDRTLIDFNRAGVPLMELVTKPAIRSATEAARFGRELQLLLKGLEVAHANMEKGEMRVEANVSVSREETLGTKVEIKNLNSFRSVERAVAFEMGRQVAILSRGERVIQETRGWDEEREETFSQRLKEESHDYRYFPEPDLPTFLISEIAEFGRVALETVLPELPSIRRERYLKDWGLKPEDVEVFLSDDRLRNLFEAAVEPFRGNKKLVQLTANYLTSDLLGILHRGDGNIENVASQAVSELVQMVEKGEIGSRGAKDILAIIAKESGLPRSIAERIGILQKSDEEELAALIKVILEKHPGVVRDFMEGKVAAVEFLLGEVMKETRGAANPAVARKLLLNTISSH